MTAIIERRTVVEGAEITAAGDGRSFSGRVAPFNSKTYIGPAKRGFYEQIDPAAFESNKGADVVALWNHNVDSLLGRTASGTLTLETREDGLWDTIDLPDTSTGNDVRTLVARGDIRGQSFGFEVLKDSWDLAPGGHAQVRTLMDVKLYDVSPVTMPAYSDTTAAVRSAYQCRSALTYNDATQALQTALGTKLGITSEDYVWIADMNDSWVVYQVNYNGPLMQASYELSDTGASSFGTPVEVKKVTTYAPIEATPAPTVDEGRKQLGLVQARARVLGITGGMFTTTAQKA